MPATSEIQEGNIPADQPARGDVEADRIGGLGQWIWAPETFEKQTCLLWRAFDIPHDTKVTRARLRIGVDNGYRLMLDGREVGTGSDWRSITEYDISLLLNGNRHVLAVEAFNDNREAGMVFGLQIDLSDGRVIEIPSDSEWRIAPTGESGWEDKREAPAHWRRAVEMSGLVRGDSGGLYERKPSMVVKVPVSQPLDSHFWQRGWFQAVLWITVCITALLYLRVLAKLTVQSRAQQMLHTERARIARDIHDELGARLTELALEGEVIQMELPEESVVRPRLEALCEKARAVSGAMDEVVWMVNSRRDTLGDFTNFACKHAQRVLATTQIRCRLDVKPDLPEMVLELPVRRNLLLGVKEALNNAVKHSQAAEIRLRIQRDGQSVLIAIEDNGVGFDLEKADLSRNGLTNMIDRMQELGGKGRVVTSSGAGCIVEFRVPLSKAGNRPDPVSGKIGQPLAGIHGKEVVSR